MGTKSPVEAAQVAIGIHNDELGIDDEGSPSIALFHMLVSLIEWSDKHQVNLDLELEQARVYLQGRF